MISVVIPVGPSAGNRRWLDEALESVDKQSMHPSEVLLIDDSGDPKFDLHQGLRGSLVPTTVWKSPWNLGVAHAFNCGVGLAREKLVFMLGSDDTLEPECLEKCYQTYMRNADDLAYYFVGVRYMDTGELQTTPCGAVMVTKRLWRHTGGFPLQSASGASDGALLSIMFGHGEAAGRLRPVADAVPLYNYRRHDETDTASKGPWQGIILATRDLVTREWKPRA